jgi:hypothetical protein
MSALEKKRVLLEQEVSTPAAAFCIHNGFEVHFSLLLSPPSPPPQVLKALQHPHVVGYLGHFFQDDALHVREALLALCNTVTLCSHYATL